MNVLHPSMITTKVEIFWKLETNLIQKLVKSLCQSSNIFRELLQFKLEVMSKKTSSLQGIVRPPIGWSYSNCSLLWLSNSWNDFCFKYDIGITNLFISSPTYTARYPFGTPTDFEDDALLMILGKRKPIVVLYVLKRREWSKIDRLVYRKDSSFWTSNESWNANDLCWC